MVQLARRVRVGVDHEPATSLDAKPRVYIGQVEPSARH